MNRRKPFSTKKISNKIIIWVLSLLILTISVISFSVVTRITNDNVKITNESLNMLSTSIFQNLRNIMNTGDIELIKKVKNDAKTIQGVKNLEIHYKINTNDKNILKSYETKKVQLIEIDDNSGHFLRMIKPMLATKECLSCHTSKNIDDVIGVIDLTFSLKSSDENLSNIIKNIVYTSVVFCFFIMIIVFFIIKDATKPIEGLKRGFARLLDSDESYKDMKLKVRSTDEISDVAVMFNQYMDKLQKDLLIDAKNFSAQIIDALPSIILTTNIETKKLQTINNSFIDFFGVDSVEEFNKNYGECICETFEYKEGHSFLQKFIDGEYWYNYIKNRPKQIHKVLIKKDNKDYIFKITVGVFSLGELNYNVAILSDITDLQNTKDQLVSLNSCLEEKVKDEVIKNKEQEKLLVKKEKIAALGEMMDAIAHQWKQPLNVIKIEMDQLNILMEFEENISNEDIQKTQKVVNSQIDHLITTIDEFRQFFRPNQKRSSINIKNSLASVESLMKNVLLANKIKVTINCDENIEYELIETEFKHIFINLLSNAKDAFIENNIENREIKIDVEKTNKDFKIIIEDNAGGIPKYIIEDIFRANVTTKDEGKGTGIGLYLVTQIIEKLQGKIYVQNISGGAKFTIELPLNPNSFI
jgi:signal transduction histidine kinase